MISAPVPKNTGLYPQNWPFATQSNDLSAICSVSSHKADLSANKALIAMNCAPMAEIAGFYP
jgi:hypothetical protein